MAQIDKINSINWTQYSGPEYYNAEKVPEALCELAHLDKQENLNETYNMVLNAIGNNHSGTYYPVVVDAIDFIIDTALNNDSEVARNCALDMMTDLYCTFSPELGSYNCLSFDEVERAVTSQIEFVLDKLETLCISNSESTRNKKLAGELVDEINELLRQKT